MTADTGTQHMPRINALNDNLSRNWWIVALRGAFAIMFGVIAFFWPDITMLSMVIVFSAYSLVDGALNIVLAIRGARRGERWGLLLLLGILGIVAGIVAAVWPGITVITFVLLVAFWAVFTGGIIIAASFDVRINHGRWWLVLGGIASIIYGAVLFIAPLLGALVLTWWIGAHALVLGTTLIVVAFKLRMRRSQRPQRAAHARAS
jgi:uncharacterized membrane protein HdeD (DUF308 family)